MPTLFQINECLNFSTGRIAQQIGEKAILHGWESWIAYSGRQKEIPSQSHSIRVGSYAASVIHYAWHRICDGEGLSSKKETKKLIEKIEKVRPDIIHLHNIHDHWINYPILFNYLSKIHKPVVWTQHDCWAFTGGCKYFDMLNCEEWKHNGCRCCNERRSVINRAASNFYRKKSLLSEIDNLTFVPVSDWLAGLLNNSVQKDRPIITIHNGIDTSTFNYISKDKGEGRGIMRLLGVAGVWEPRKGLNDFYRIREILPENEFEITLVGLSKKQLSKLPSGINGISSTQNVQELARIYSEADVYINPTYSDNFPTTNIESLACGTPVITYNTGGSPEAIDGKTGLVIEQGDIDALVKAIYSLRESQLKPDDCRTRAVSLFDKNKCYDSYIELYNQLLKP